MSVDFFLWLSVKTWQPLYEPGAKRTFPSVVSQFESCANSPPQPRRGGCDIKKKQRSLLDGAAGVVLVRKCFANTVTFKLRHD